MPSGGLGQSGYAGMIGNDVVHCDVVSLEHSIYQLTDVCRWACNTVIKCQYTKCGAHHVFSFSVLRAG